MPSRERLAVARVALATTTIVTLVAVMPLLAACSARAHSFDYTAEVQDFDRWLKTWSPGSAADHLRVSKNGRGGAP